MFQKVVPLLACIAVVAHGAPAILSGHGYIPGGESVQQRNQDSHGNYGFTYKIVDGLGATNGRSEQGDGYGNKVGSYELADIDGRVRRVDYVADDLGFRATIKTNEPGTVTSDTAAASYLGPAGVVGHAGVLKGGAVLAGAPAVLGIKTLAAPLLASPIDHSPLALAAPTPLIAPPLALAAPAIKGYAEPYLAGPAPLALSHSAYSSSIAHPSPILAAPVAVGKGYGGYAGGLGLVGGYGGLGYGGGLALGGHGGGLALGGHGGGLALGGYGSGLALAGGHGGLGYGGGLALAGGHGYGGYGGVALGGLGYDGLAIGHGGLAGPIVQEKVAY